jgi:pimeloyl-ACP methyl ester carboxylesterase
MRKDKIVYRNSVLQYSVYGDGSLKMLAFHGYGQDSRAFLSYREALRNHTLYVFDLFLFGGSRWEEEERTLAPARWHELMNAFLQSERIDVFELAGFSLGARIALQTFCLFPGRVRRLILIAPEGIRINPWYRFATGRVVSRALFRHTMHNPWLVRVALAFLKATGSLGPWEYKFIGKQLSTPSARLRVYRVWILYRHMMPRTSTLTALLSQMAVPVTIFAGRNDSIIRPSSVYSLLKKIPYAELIELPSGHGSMIIRSGQWLAAREG